VGRAGRRQKVEAEQHRDSGSGLPSPAAPVADQPVESRERGLLAFVAAPPPPESRLELERDEGWPPVVEVSAAIQKQGGGALASQRRAQPTRVELEGVEMVLSADQCFRMTPATTPWIRTRPAGA
jgi:hypothetical protein